MFDMFELFDAGEAGLFGGEDVADAAGDFAGEDAAVGLVDEPADGPFLGGSASPPWADRPWADGADWDNDSIPNYADHWNGPGAHDMANAFKADAAPWEGRPWADKEDWDNDGVPNYADHNKGFGAQDPMKAISSPAAAPWDASPHARFQDWDHDGTPNYADHWNGPGAHADGLLGSAAPAGVERAGLPQETAETLGHSPAEAAVFELDFDSYVFETPDVPLDMDGDGFVDDPAAQEAFSAEESHALWPEELVYPGFEAYHDEYGTSEEALALYDSQDETNSCAVASTNMMFRSLGFDVGEDVLAEYFYERGIYYPEDGSIMYLLDDGINDFAEEHGIPVRASEFRFDGVDDLRAMLDQGVRPTVAADSAELYEGGDSLLQDLAQKFGFIPGNGHAVQVVDVHDTPDGAVVVINDPWEGPGIAIPADRFMAATEDFGNFGVAMKAA